MAIELTPAKLAELKKKAAGCDPKYWIMDQHGDVVAVDFDNKNTKLKIASVDFLDDAEHIAAADPATVLAMVEEIETLKRAMQEFTWDLCGIDLEQEQIDKICSEWIDKAKMLMKSEAGQ